MGFALKPLQTVKCVGEGRMVLHANTVAHIHHKYTTTWAIIHANHAVAYFSWIKLPTGVIRVGILFLVVEPASRAKGKQNANTAKAIKKLLPTQYMNWMTTLTNVFHVDRTCTCHHFQLHPKNAKHVINCMISVKVVLWVVRKKGQFAPNVFSRLAFNMHWLNSRIYRPALLVGITNIWRLMGHLAKSVARFQPFLGVRFARSPKSEQPYVMNVTNQKELIH